jgi:hypothetical protein
MADKTLADWLADPDALAALLADPAPAPIQNAMAISIARSPLLVALIAEQLAGQGWNSGSP